VDIICSLYNALLPRTAGINGDQMHKQLSVGCSELHEDHVLPHRGQEVKKVIKGAFKLKLPASSTPQGFFLRSYKIISVPKHSEI